MPARADGTPRVRCPVRSHVKLCGEKARKIGQQMSGVGSSDLNGDVSGAKGRGDWIKTNQGVACCIAGVAVALLVYLCSSEWAYRELRDGFRLGFFTAVAVFAMQICALTMIVDRQRHDRRSPRMLNLR